MKIGFIGLGNVGGKPAGSLLRNGFDLTVAIWTGKRRAASSTGSPAPPMGGQPPGGGAGLRPRHHPSVPSPAAFSNV